MSQTLLIWLRYSKQKWKFDFYEIAITRKRKGRGRAKKSTMMTVRTMSEQFTDRIRTFFVIGDAIRAFRGSLNRPPWVQMNL